MVQKGVVALFGVLAAVLPAAGPALAAAGAGAGREIAFTAQMGLVFAILALVIALFVFAWVRVDLVGLLMMVLLPALSLVTPQEAVSGLASNAVVAIIAVIIIGAGLDKTGCMNILSRWIIRLAGKSEHRIMALIASAVAVISSFMQNIGAAALFMPAVVRIGRQTGIPASRILMPMGFCAIIGGTLTLVGASPTILVNDLIAQANRLDPAGGHIEPLGLFTQTPIGLGLVVTAILYFTLFGRYILPTSHGDGNDSRLLPSRLADTYQEVAGAYELFVPEDFGAFTLEELHVRDRYHVTIAGVYMPDKKVKNYAPARYEMIRSGETLVMVGNEAGVRRCAEDLGLVFRGDLDVFAEDFSANNAGMMEGIVTPRSRMVGRTMREMEFRKTNEVVPLVLCRDGQCQFDQITREHIRTGDALLMFGRWDKFRALQKKEYFVYTNSIRGEEMHPEKAGLAVAWLVATLVLIMGLEPLTTLLGFPVRLSLSVQLLAGALGMILTGVLTIDEAYQSIDWMTIFLLAGLIPLGLAFQKTGAAEWMAAAIMGAVGDVPEVVFFLIVGLLTSFFTLVVSNVGATVLLVPLCMAMATARGSDPRLVAMLVALAASNTFLLPTHQVNALIMRPGDYQTADYLRAGSGMTLLFLIVLIGMLVTLY